MVGQQAGGVGARRVGVGGRSGGGMSGRKRGATERRAGVTGGGVQLAGGGRRSRCRSSGELWWSSRQVGPARGARTVAPAGVGEGGATEHGWGGERQSVACSDAGGGVW